MKKFLFLVTFLVAALASFAHVWEIRVNQAQNGTLTWYLQSYHSPAEGACGTNYPQSGLRINGVNYPIQSIASGSIVGLSNTIFAQNTSCGTSRLIYGVITTPFLGTNLTVQPYSNVACWDNCNINAVGNFVPPPPPVCTSCPLTGWSNTIATSGNNNGTPCQLNDDVTTANIKVDHLACANITGDKQFSVVFDPGGANTTYGPFNYAAGVETNVTINIPAGTSNSTQVKVIDADFPCEITHGLNIPGGNYIGEKETVAPVISCGQSVIVSATQGTCGAVVNYSMPTATDNCSQLVAGSLQFNYSGSIVPWVVPAGVTSIKIKAWGAEGGSPTNNNSSCGGAGAGMGGNGGYAEGDLAVTPGKTLYIAVGGAGFAGNNGGFNGGGRGSSDPSTTATGGGASDVRTGSGLLTDRIIVAGGGGAAEWSGYCREAGAGGGFIGGVGSGDNSGSSGAPGTQTNGGAQGSDPCNWSPQAGQLGLGGNSALGHSGAGGGGYYGGGAGGCDGHGAGGSSYIGGVTAGLTNPGVQTGNGKIEISWSGIVGPPVTQTAGLPSGSVFPVGITINTFVATDESGNTATCSFTVTVIDNQNPTISVSNVSVNADNNSCNAAGVNLGTPATGDNCGVLSVSNNAPASFPVGNTNVIWTVTDLHGNTATSTQMVTVLDSQDPVISVSNVSANADNGTCIATNVDLGIPVTSDNCGVLSVSNNAPASYAVGNTIVTWTVRDVNGRTATTTQTVTVLDNQNPTIVNLPSNIVTSNDAGVCGAAVSWTVPTSADNCSGSTIAQTGGLPNGSIFPTGTSVIVYTATDAAGNIYSASFTVTVNDTEAPVIICPADIIVNNDVDACGANVTLPVLSISDNCGEITYVENFDNYTNGPVSTQSGLWRPWEGGSSAIVATNQASSPAKSLRVSSFQDQLFLLGDHTSGKWNVNFRMFVPPTRTAYYNIQHMEVEGIEWAQQVQFSSNGTGILNVEGLFIPFNYPQGTWFDIKQVIDLDADQSSLSINGVIVRTWQFSKRNNNAPGTKKLGSFDFFAATSNYVNSEPNPAAVSLFYIDDITVTGSGSQLGSYIPRAFSRSYSIGTTPVTINVKDEAGNATNCSFNVTVNDVQAPQVVNLPANISVVNNNGVCGATINWTAPTASDNCTGASIAQTAGLANGTVFPVGTTTVTYTATDASGNTTSASFNVTVADTEVPKVTCASLSSGYIVNTAGCTYMVNGTAFDATATDNCSVQSIINSYTGTATLAGASFPVGSTNVVWTATDIHGNTSSCTITVNVSTNLAVSIANNSVLPQGVNANTIYIGYTPASTLTLTVSPSGSLSNTYTYNWSVSSNLLIVGSNTNQNVQITSASPNSNSSYTVTLTVTDGYGCTKIINKQVYVVDVRCGNKNDKVMVCQNTGSTKNPYVDICVAPSAVATHLANGSTLGSCPVTSPKGTVKTEPTLISTAIKAYPNPSTGIFELQLSNYKAGKVQVQVLDSYGKLVNNTSLVIGAKIENTTIDIRRYAAGAYTVRVISEEGITSTKVIVQR